LAFSILLVEFPSSGTLSIFSDLFIGQSKLDGN
jgi:hypothetical protein